MKTRGDAPSHSGLRRALRPPLARARVYRVVVPLFLVVLAFAMGVLVILVVGILVGLVPYPGR